MGTITVITSGKGGVGKSVFTAGLGYALAGRGRRVLLVDCDAGLRSLDYICLFNTSEPPKDLPG